MNIDSFKLLFDENNIDGKEYKNFEFRDFYEKLIKNFIKPEYELNEYIYLPIDAEISKREYTRN
ncbi:MAG: hypothetical protein HF967_01570 [Methanosarcinales archaeon]|jgi:hypothetical protein|nr:hypothetical protein [Methanosarcinales archaeon]